MAGIGAGVGVDNAVDVSALACLEACDKLDGMVNIVSCVGRLL